MKWYTLQGYVASLMLPIAILMLLFSLISLFFDGVERAVALVLWIVLTVSWTALLALYVYAGWRWAR